MSICGCVSNINVNTNGKHYLLLKVNKSGYLQERKVYIKRYSGKGNYIVVQSGNGTEKDKNQIPLFLINPMEIDTVQINNVERKSIVINRHNEYPLILTSNNEILLDLFEEEVNEYINQLNRFQFYLSKWSYIMSNDSVRILSKMVYKLRLNKAINEKNEILNGRINGYSKKILISSLRYFSFNLKHGPMGYSKLQNIFFNIWKTKWKKECITYDLEKNFNSVKQYMDLFSVLEMSEPVESEFNIFSFKNTLNDLFIKTSKIQKELEVITTNLGNLCYHNNVETTEKKMDIVTNLQKMADLYHNIQYIRNECEEFVIIGDQSSGKSCLLSMLLGVNVAYSDDKFATRCPVRYLLEPCDPDLCNLQAQELEKVQKQSYRSQVSQR